MPMRAHGRVYEMCAQTCERDVQGVHGLIWWERDGVVTGV